MTPRSLLSGLSPRWLSLAGAVLFSAFQIFNLSAFAPPLPPPSLVRHTNWFSVVATDASGATAESNVRSSDLSPALLEWIPAAGSVTNFAVIITRTNADGRIFKRTLNVGTNTAAVWPPPTVALSNCVVTVTVATATAASLDDPWVTNTAILFCATNPPGMQLFRQCGLSVTITNF